VNTGDTVVVIAATVGTTLEGATLEGPTSAGGASFVCTDCATSVGGASFVCTDCDGHIVVVAAMQVLH